jgi:thymidine phosphorylase
MIGQTSEIAPADRKALRAARRHRNGRKPLSDLRLHHEQEDGGGNRRLVLDVKTGCGAFMKKEADAEFLAER